MKAAEYLEKVAARPEMFVSPLDVQTLKSFLDGFTLGYLLAKDDLEFSDKVAVWKYVVEVRGWKVNSFGVNKEMRERGKSEKEIFEENLQIEIDVWKILESKDFRVWKSN